MAVKLTDKIIETAKNTMAIGAEEKARHEYAMMMAALFEIHNICVKAGFGELTGKEGPDDTVAAVRKMAEKNKTRIIIP